MGSRRREGPVWRGLQLEADETDEDRELMESSMSTVADREKTENRDEEQKWSFSKCFFSYFTIVDVRLISLKSKHFVKGCGNRLKLTMLIQ